MSPQFWVCIVLAAIFQLVAMSNNATPRQEEQLDIISGIAIGYCVIEMIWRLVW